MPITNSTFPSLIECATDEIERTNAQIRQALTLLGGVHPFSSDLPWRTNRSPYRVFLAEFLLVRTRADIVAARFEGIVERFPSIADLARSSEEEIAVVLAPLGLRKRAIILSRAAHYILDEFAGAIPDNVADLLRVPGMGAYTATAVKAFVFGGQDIPADVNIFRFLSRLTGRPMLHRTKGSPALRDLLPLLTSVPNSPSPEILLDFTRLVCKTREPHCGECPLPVVCEYAKARTASSVP